MKVLQINSVCGIGSTGRIATDIHNLLISKGHESIIAYGREPIKNCNENIKIGNKIDFYCHVISSRMLDDHGSKSKQATKKLISQIRLENPDIIHLHNIHGYYINIKLLFEFLKNYNKPVVWTLHDCWSFTGHCSYFDYIECNKWIEGCFNCPQKKEYPKSICIDNSKRNYQNKKDLFTGINNLTIVTPSQWLKELVDKSFLNTYESVVINNGIDLDIFKRTDSNFRKEYCLEGKYLILGVASIWDPRKGLKYFNELAKTLNENERIILVGLSKSQASEVHDNIVGIERTNNINELVSIYSSVDVFLNPTLEDNFPTTNLEALACGVPVITFNTGGSPECVDDRTGLIVSQRNIKGILNALNEVKKYNKIYIDDCRDRAVLKYNKLNRYEEYFELYYSMLYDRIGD